MKTFYKIALFFALLVSVSGVFAQVGERERGIELYKQGNYAQAIDVLEGVSRRDDAKNDAEVWNYLGLSYVEGEKLKSGINALEKAVKLKPENADFRTNLAYAYLLNGKMGDANSEIRKAFALDPKNVRVLYVRGTARLREEKIGDALDDAETIINIDKNYTMGYALKSDALIALFGKSIGGRELAKGEAEFLRKAIEPLEYCLKYCQNNPNLNALNGRLEAAKAFYNYFNQNKTDDAGQASVASKHKTPLKFLNRPMARYTDKAREANIQGTVTLCALFAANGKVSHIILIKKLGYGLDEEFINAVRQMQFEPATEDGKPVSVVKTMSYSFSIY